MRLAAICTFLLALNCGGGDKPADHPQSTPETSDAGQTADVGPTTTTTILMGDGGELQGSKLTTTAGPTTLDGGRNEPPKPNATDRDPGRSQQDLITIIQTHRAEARACYDTYEKTHKGSKGNVDITWKLDPQGKVVETGVDESKSDIKDPDLVKCIGDVIRKINWAASPRGFETKAHYPFNFQPH